MENSALMNAQKSPGPRQQSAFPAGLDNDNATRLAYLEERRIQNGESDGSTEVDHNNLPDPPNYNPSDESPSPSNKRRRNIDDCIAELQTNTYNSLPRRGVQGADTAVFIDPPAKEPQHSDYQYSEICTYYREPFFVNSAALLSTGSEKFQTDLGPTAQFRITRRRQAQVTRVQATFPQITKFLDLTPKVEGQDAVQMVLDLCLPKGVRLWGLSRARFGVSVTLAGGKDEFATLISTQELNANNVDTPSVFAARYEEPADYSALRHRACIQRVLLAIEGQDPCLDSAAKVYSTAILAKAFGIIQSPLADYIVRWLRAAPNNIFLEVMPEVALKIAECIECESIARDAFAILVGENALEHQVLENGGAFMDMQSTHTVHMRRKEDLSEEWENRIQYARFAFHERIRARFDNLVDQDMLWMNDLAEYRTLLSDPAEDTEAMQEFRASIKDFTRSALYIFLTSTYSLMNDHNVKGHLGLPQLYPMLPLKDTWDNLKPMQRFFTRPFWEILRGMPWEALVHGRSLPNLLVERTDGTYGGMVESESTRLYRHCGLIKPVQIAHLKNFRYAAFDASRLPGTSKKHLSEQTRVDEIDGQHSQSNDDEPGKVDGVSQNGEPSGAQSKESSKPSKGLVVPKVSWLEESLKERGARFTSDEGTTIENENLHSLAGAQHSSLQGVGRAQAGSAFEWEQTGSVREVSERLVLHQSSQQQSQQQAQTSSTIADLQERKRGYTPFHPDYKMKPNNFSFLTLFRQISYHLTLVAQDMLGWPQETSFADQNELSLSNVLISLEESELKYLPLWAGGLDDGSGGIFGSDIPFAENGFAPGGGFRGINSNIGSSNGSFSEVDASSSAGGTSALVHDGYGETMDRRRVYATSEAPSSADSAIDWTEVLNSKRQREGVHMSDAGGVTTASGDNDSDSFDVLTPTGDQTQTQPPDLSQADEKLIARALQEDAANDDFADIFDDSDADDFASLVGDNDSDVDVDMDMDMDMEMDIVGDDDQFTEDQSYRGFDGASSTREDVFMDAEDRGENFGASFGRGKGMGKAKGKGKEKAKSSVVPGSIAEMDRAYNPTYVYKEGPEDELMTRP